MYFVPAEDFVCPLGEPVTLMHAGHTYSLRYVELLVLMYGIDPKGRMFGSNKKVSHVA